MKKLVVASENRGKIKEIKSILEGKYEVVPMSEAGFSGEIEEDGATFYENALKKAKTVSETLGCDALADDSGLCVDALGGAPGVYSARFSGTHGNDKLNREVLLEKMKDEKNRKAKFVSCVVIYTKEGAVIEGHGQTEGTISYEEVGKNGFGYDCIFISDDLGISFGIATDEQKNSVSHRYRALKDILGKL